MPKPDRHVPDGLVPQVLRKAAELERSKAPLDGPDSLTLEEIVQIGAEVGLSAVAIERAAGKLDAAGRARADDVFEVVIPRALDDAEIGELVAVVRRGLAKFGEVNSEPDTVVWSATPAAATTFVNFVREPDRTVVQLLGNYTRNAKTVDIAMQALGALWILVGFFAAASGTVGPGFWAFFAGASALWGASWIALRRSARNARARLAALGDRVLAEAKGGQAGLLPSGSEDARAKAGAEHG